MIGELIGVIGLLLFPICTYVIAKRLKNDAIDDILGYLESDEGLKYIYKLGVVAGSGIRQGIGISKGKGKFNLEAIVGEAIGGFAQQFLNKAVGGQESGGTPEKTKERRSVPKM